MKDIFKSLHIRPQYLAVFLLVAVVASLAWYNQGRVQPVTSSASVSSALAGPAATCNFYASPTGLSSGDGSTGNPWDLQTALNQPNSLVPGSTLCLKGGTYNSVYTSAIDGASGNEITIRSAPGEWAIVDGYVHSTLASNITANQMQIPLVDASSFSGSSPEAKTVSIGSEQFRYFGKTGNSLNVYDVRPQGAAHSAGAIVKASQDAALTVNGSYVVFRDFEIKNSDPDRLTDADGFRIVGLNDYAPHSKILNMVIHDTGEGLGFWDQATDSIACGNILYNNGEDGNGHGIYTQNHSGTKLLCDNTTFGNFALGMQTYSTNGPPMINFTFDGNIDFNDQYLFGGDQVMDNFLIKNTFLYGVGIAMGYANSGPHGSATIQNNYIYATGPFQARNWTHLNVHDNKFYQMQTDQGAVIALENPPNTPLSNYTFTNNTYIHGRSFADAPFTISNGIDTEPQYYSASQWQTALGDNSSFTGPTSQNQTPTVPTGTDIFYRANSYETGRGNVIIYNYAHTGTVSLNLSQVGLQSGQQYQLRNTQDYTGNPITTGTYNGGSINVSLANIHVAQPLTNNGESNQDTCPEFCVFTVVPVTAGSPPSDTTPPVLSAGAPSGSQSAGSTSVNMTLTTNEAATCKYGTTANVAYGSIVNTFTTTGSTSHSKTLTGLTNGTSYTYYVRCQDTSGNPTTSDYTISFSVASAGDSTAPTVSVTAPTNGATVSGSSVTVSATANDNVGVVGVQFKLDGSNLGAEDTSSPYSITWDTTSASNSSHTLTAVARDAATNSTTSSGVSVTANNVVPPSTVATPVISPNGGSFSSTQNITITTSTSGAAIHYTVDGSTPTSGSPTYGSGLSVPSTETVKAIGIKSGMTNSSVASATFTITAPSQVVAPTISPNGGNFTSAQSISLSTTTAGASIYYTTNGSTPTTSSSLYSAPFSLAGSNTVKAIAVKSGMTDSSIASADFIITIPQPTGGGGGGGGGGGSSSGGAGGSSGGGGGTKNPPTASTTHLINSSGTYYLVSSGQKKGVTSPGILYSCGFDLPDATTATASDLSLPAAFLLPCDGALVKSQQDPTVYFISAGKRYGFTSASVFLALGHKFSSVLIVTNPELQALPKASDLSNSTASHLPGTDISASSTIYWIDGGQRHPYPSMSVYNSWHKDNDFSQVVPANSADLALPIGSNVGMRLIQ